MQRTLIKWLPLKRRSLATTTGVRYVMSGDYIVSYVIYFKFLYPTALKESLPSLNDFYPLCVL